MYWGRSTISFFCLRWQNVLNWSCLESISAHMGCLDALFVRNCVFCFPNPYSLKIVFLTLNRKPFYEPSVSPQPSCVADNEMFPFACLQLESFQIGISESGHYEIQNGSHFHWSLFPPRSSNFYCSSCSSVHSVVVNSQVFCKIADTWEFNCLKNSSCCCPIEK